MRDKLAEIIRNARMNANPLSQVGYAEADALIENGVTLPSEKPITNFDRIKAMSVEEMAEFLVKITGCCTWDDCEHCPLRLRACTSEFYVKEWLESEVQEDEKT